MSAKAWVTCYKTLGICYLTCYVPFDIHNMRGYECKTWQGENKKEKGRLRGKNCRGRVEQPMNDHLSAKGKLDPREEEDSIAFGVQAKLESLLLAYVAH
jgi:hypothetical protein